MHLTVRAHTYQQSPLVQHSALKHNVLTPNALMLSESKHNDAQCSRNTDIASASTVGRSMLVQLLFCPTVNHVTSSQTRATRVNTQTRTETRLCLSMRKCVAREVGIQTISVYVSVMCATFPLVQKKGDQNGKRS